MQEMTDRPQVRCTVPFLPRKDKGRIPKALGQKRKSGSNKISHGKRVVGTHRNTSLPAKTVLAPRLKAAAIRACLEETIPAPSEEPPHLQYGL